MSLIISTQTLTSLKPDFGVAAGEHLSVFNYKSVNNILNQEDFIKYEKSLL